MTGVFATESTPGNPEAKECPPYLFHRVFHRWLRSLAWQTTRLDDVPVIALQHGALQSKSQTLSGSCVARTRRKSTWVRDDQLVRVSIGPRSAV
jgi:hypothetical protein